MNIKPLTSTRAWKSEPRRSSFAFFFQREQCGGEKKKTRRTCFHSCYSRAKVRTKNNNNNTSAWIPNAWEVDRSQVPDFLTHLEESCDQQLTGFSFALREASLSLIVRNWFYFFFLFNHLPVLKVFGRMFFFSGFCYCCCVLFWYSCFVFHFLKIAI